MFSAVIAIAEPQRNTLLAKAQAPRHAMPAPQPAATVVAADTRHAE